MTPRAVLLVLDGLPHRHVCPRVTPNLCALASTGGFAPEGGVAVLTSATYPNHATLVTGVDPGWHGITGNFVARDGGVHPAAELGPGVATLFDLDVSSAAVYGDQNLVGVTAATQASAHWPPDGAVPDDAARTTDGYVADETTVTHLVAALDSDADLVVAQLNGPDTAGHAFGPDTDKAAAAYHATDAHLTTIVDALRPRWGETFVAIVSDHDQVTVADPTCIDPWAASRRAGLDLTVIPEGEAVVISGDDATDGRWLDAVPGVAGHQPWYGGTRLAWADRGRVFGWGQATLKGIHGGPTTRTMVAVVAGGHPAVRQVATRIATEAPHAQGWAAVLANVLGRQWPGDGLSPTLTRASYLRARP